MLAHQIFDALASGQRITALTVIERSKVCAQRSRRRCTPRRRKLPGSGVFRLAKRFRSWPDKPYLDKMLGRRAMVCHSFPSSLGLVSSRWNSSTNCETHDYLLDVNVLLALSDPMHHHEAGHRWFAAGVHLGHLSDHRKRFGSDRQPSQLPESSGDVPAVLAILRQFCATAGHHFWSEDVSIRKLLQPVRSFLI